MTAYVPLLRFALSHQYFSDGCSPLHFVPTAACQAMMKKLDLLVRADAASFTVYCPDTDLADLQKGGSAAAPLTLDFKIFPHDRNFARYTSPLASIRDDVLYLDSRNAVKSSDGRLRLHAEDSVTVSSFQDWNSPLVQAMVTRQDAVLRPCMIVRLSPVAPADAGGQVPAYYVVFSAYASYWKYYLQGDIAKRDLSISDVNGKIEFTSLGLTDIANGKALAFVSSSAIPMQDMPPQRFQLLENGAMGEKVLIKRLPNAAIGQVSRENIKQEAALVSEMYIN